MFSLLPQKKSARLALALPMVAFSLFLWFFVLASIGYTDGGPGVWVATQNPPGLVGDKITVTIGITNVVDLYGAEFIVSFDSSKLQVVDANSSMANTQIVSGDCATDSRIHLVENTTGVVRYMSSQLSSSPTSGDCIIAQIPFQIQHAITDGTTINLTFDDFILVDSGGSIDVKNKPSIVSLSVSNAPTPSATPTSSATATATGSATATATGSATATATGSATATATGSATATATGSATATATGSATATPTGTQTATATATATGSATGSATATPTGTQTATATPTATGSATATPTGTQTPTSTPTATGSATNTPTTAPTGSPTITATPAATATTGPTSTSTVTPSTNMNLQVDHIEVNQTIQDMSNSVPMVANRPAMARVYIEVQNGSATVSNVTAKLHASRGGSELSDSPISPFNSGGTMSAPLTANREQLNHTLNFQLPTSWLTAGNLTLWAEVNPAQTVDERDYTDNRSSDVSLTFSSVPRPQVVLVPIAYQKNGTGTVYRPSLNGGNNLGLGMMQEIYPIDQVAYTLHSEYMFKGDMGTQAGWLQLLSEMNQLRLLERPDESLYGANVMPKYYGVLPMEAVLYGGLAYRPGTTGIGLVEQDDVAAHEVGHNLNLLHVGVCGGPTGADSSYPYTDGYIENVGMNVYTQELIDLTRRDMMAYCWPKWISDYHYNKIRDVLLTVSRQPKPSKQERQEALLVTGRINSDRVSGTLNHAIPAESNNIVEAPGSGEYRIELRDPENNLLFSYLFDPVEVEFLPREGESGGEEGQVADFGFALPKVANLGRIQLWKGNTPIASLTASAKPEISASFAEDPNDSDKLIISWQATESAHINIRYSPDNGQTWQMLALEERGNSFTVSKSQLAASENGLIEVIASDTTETSTAALEVGEISNKAPQVEISGVEGNVLEEEIIAGEAIVLNGMAVDFEDGIVPDENLSWDVSPSDNITTTGHTLIIVDGLEAGSYTITFTAVDNDGNRSNTSVEITVISADPVTPTPGASPTPTSTPNPILSPTPNPTSTPAPPLGRTLYLPLMQR